MTKLEQAFAEAAQLPASEQEALAAWILEEIHSERRWTEAFIRSEEVLGRLADEALAEYRAGQTEELDPETL
jgi:hypothetical protein